jgi:glycine dehydrogenase subunit 1
MKELGEAILQRQVCLKKVLSKIKGVKLDRFSGTPFEEIVVDFSGTGKTVKEINEKLLEKGILGGFDLGKCFPGLEGCSLLCVTEQTTAEDIKAIADALSEILG